MCSTLYCIMKQFKLLSLKIWQLKLKEAYYFLAHSFILGCYLNMLTTLVLKKYTLSETLCLSLCLFKTEANTQTPLIGWLTHAWHSSSNKNRAAVLNQFLHAKLAVRYSLCKGVTWWRSVMSQSHWIKDGTSGEALQRKCFLREWGAIGANFLTFKIFYMHNKIYKTLKEK